MSAIKINHYEEGQITAALRSELQQFAPDIVSLDLASDRSIDSGNKHVFTIASEESIYGFAILKLADNVAKIMSVFIKGRYRNKSLGSKLLLHILSNSKKLQCQKVELSCEKDQLGFFQNFGFVISKNPNEKLETTEYTLENACPQYFVSVYKKQQIERQQDKATAKQPLVLSQDNTLYNYDDQEQFSALHRNMLSQAKRRIWIVADTINSPILRDEQFSQSILQLAKQNAEADIRILLQDDKTGAGHFNPLVSLAQRLTSFVEIRTIDKTSSGVAEMITVVDHSAGIYRKSLSAYTGFATYNNHLISKRLQDKFDHLWQFANASSEFRRLAM